MGSTEFMGVVKWVWPARHMRIIYKIYLVW